MLRAAFDRGVYSLLEPAARSRAQWPGMSISDVSQAGDNFAELNATLIMIHLMVLEIQAQQPPAWSAWLEKLGKLQTRLHLSPAPFEDFQNPEEP